MADGYCDNCDVSMPRGYYSVRIHAFHFYLTENQMFHWIKLVPDWSQSLNRKPVPQGVLYLYLTASSISFHFISFQNVQSQQSTRNNPHSRSFCLTLTDTKHSNPTGTSVLFHSVLLSRFYFLVHRFLVCQFLVPSLTVSGLVHGLKVTSFSNT